MQRADLVARAALALHLALGVAVGALVVLRIEPAARGGFHAMAAALCAVYGTCASLVGGIEAVQAARASTSPKPASPAQLGSSGISSHLGAIAFAALGTGAEPVLYRASAAYAVATLLAVVARSTAAREPEPGKELV